MTKTALAVLSSLAVGALGCAPVHAVEGMEVGQDVMKTTARLTIFTAGAVLGIPIAVVRKTAQNTVDTSKEMAGKSENKAAKAGLGLVGVPVGVFTGGLEGVWLGTTNSWTSSKDKPFSKDLVSLGEMKD